MVKFRMICPDCGVVVIAASPQTLVWELCPGCGSHIWDLSDVLMADVVTDTMLSELKCGMEVQ